jgi:hypothetical protein
MLTLIGVVAESRLDAPVAVYKDKTQRYLTVCRLEEEIP